MVERKIRVLMADDDEDLLEATAKALDRRGFAVTTATNGRAASQLLSRSVFDVVVLDVRMPGIDGVELFREIRHRWPTLPVVMFTGHGTFWQACATAREGLFEYLTKPIDIEALADVLRQAAETRRQAGYPEEAPAEESVRVLVVDQDTSVLELVSQTLEEVGLRVTCAEGAAQALAKLNRLLVDVVLLRVDLPGMDGLDVMRHVLRQCPGTEVILMAEEAELSKAVEGCREGAFDYVLKPLELSAIPRLVREANIRRISRAAQERESWVRNLLDEPR